MIVFAQNFRGFRYAEIDTTKINFLVGDNSSGKSSLLYLIEAVCEHDLNYAPTLHEDFGTDKYDYFSPYFRNAPVTFGFQTTGDDGKSLTKIVTVSQRDEMPNIDRCSYLHDGMMISIRKSRGRVEFRILDDVPVGLSPGPALKLHASSGNFQKIDDIPADNVSGLQGLLAVVDIKEERFKPLVRSVFGLDIKPCRLVSPIRAMPERFYQFKRRIDSRGSHFAAMWMDIKDEKEMFELIDSFGTEAKLFDNLKIKKANDDIPRPPLIVTIEKNSQSFMMNQVGIGISQVVPILIDVIFSAKYDKCPILVMQPELHLHPVAQAAFGSYLCSMAAHGLRGAFETHSSFLIDRFCADANRMSKERGAGNSQAAAAEVSFCVNGPKGNKQIRIAINDEGKMERVPDEYHRFFVDELIRTMI